MSRCGHKNINYDERTNRYMIRVKGKLIGYRGALRDAIELRDEYCRDNNLFDEVQPEGTKVCSKHGVLPLSMFPRRPENPDGRAYDCNLCIAERNAKRKQRKLEDRIYQAF